MKKQFVPTKFFGGVIQLKILSQNWPIVQNTCKADQRFESVRKGRQPSHTCTAISVLVQFFSSCILFRCPYRLTNSRWSYLRYSQLCSYCRQLLPLLRSTLVCFCINCCLYVYVHFVKIYRSFTKSYRHLFETYLQLLMSHTIFCTKYISIFTIYLNSTKFNVLKYKQ